MKYYILIIVCLIITTNSFGQKNSLEELGKAAAAAYEKKSFKTMKSLFLPKASYIKLGNAIYKKVLAESESTDVISKIRPAKIYKAVMNKAKSDFSAYMNWYDDYEIEFDDIDFSIEKSVKEALNSEIVVAFTKVTSSSYNYFFISAVKYEDGWYLLELPDFESINKYNNFKLKINEILGGDKMTSSATIDYRYYQLPGVHNCLSHILQLQNVSSSERDHYISSVIKGHFSANRLSRTTTNHPKQNDIYIKYEIRSTHNQINFLFYEHKYKKGDISYVLDDNFTPEMAKIFTKEEHQIIITELKNGYELFFNKLRNHLVEYAKHY